MQTATSDVPSHSMRGQRIMTTGALYASTVYVPFDSKTPSAYSEVAVAMDGDESKKPRKFVNRPDINIGESPVGEPWILLIFALLFGGAVARKAKGREARG